MVYSGFNEVHLKLTGRAPDLHLNPTVLQVICDGATPAGTRDLPAHETTGQAPNPSSEHVKYVLAWMPGCLTINSPLLRRSNFLKTH